MLDLVLDGGLNNGKWHIFHDPQQGIYSGLDQREIRRLIQYGCAQFPLTVNCRNTQAIAVQTSIVSGIDAATEAALDGGFSETEFVKSPEQGLERLAHWIKKLRGDGLERSDLIILGCRTLANSTLAKIDRVEGLRIRDLSTEAPGGRESIDFCTMHAFKGLERKTVFAWDLDNLDRDEQRLLHYCGLSRARTGLVTFVAERERDVYTRFAKEFGERIAKRRMV